MVLTTTAGRHLVEIKKDGFDDLQQWVDVKLNQKVEMAPMLKEVAKAQVGTIVVEADVPAAEVWLDGNKLPDKTPTVIPNVVAGLHVVEVRKPPAIPWKQTVQVVAGQQLKVSAGLKATIGGQGGSIRVLSNVNGAHVFLDGTDMGKVPVDIKDAKPGEHIIDVKAPGYQDREEKVTVNAGSAAILKLDLNPVAPKDNGKLKIVSPVPNADVFLDGASVGKVPVEKQVASGEHFVVVQLEGYKKFEVKVRIEPGQTQTVSAELGRSARSASCRRRPAPRSSSTACRRARPRSSSRSSRSARPSSRSSCPATRPTPTRSTSRAARARSSRPTSRSSARRRRSSAGCRRSAPGPCRAVTRPPTWASATRTSSRRG